jgi:hypothetical protein
MSMYGTEVTHPNVTAHARVVLPRPDSDHVTTPEDSNDAYMFIYITLLCCACALNVLTSTALYTFMVIAARRLHNQMFDVVLATTASFFDSNPVGMSNTWYMAVIDMGSWPIFGNNIYKYIFNFKSDC